MIRPEKAEDDNWKLFVKLYLGLYKDTSWPSKWSPSTVPSFALRTVRVLFEIEETCTTSFPTCNKSPLETPMELSTINFDDPIAKPAWSTYKVNLELPEVAMFDLLKDSSDTLR